MGFALTRVPLAFLREVSDLWLLGGGDLDGAVGGRAGLDPVGGLDGFEFGR